MGSDQTPNHILEGPKRANAIFKKRVITIKNVNVEKIGGK